MLPFGFALVGLSWLVPLAVVADEAGEELAVSPVVIQRADRLEVFRVDAEGELYHKWQKEPGGEWSPWVTLGGWLLPDIALAQNADGRLGVFAVDKMSKMLRYKMGADPDHPEDNWSSWTTLGDRSMFRPPPAVGTNLDGRMEVFAIDANTGNLKHVWQTNRLGGWADWQDLEVKIEPGFVVGADGEGRLEIFGTDPSSGELLHALQTTPNGSRTWSPWTSLKGNLDSKLGLGRNHDGHLEVFGLSRVTGCVEHIWQLAPGSPQAWSAWASLGGRVKAGIAIGERKDGRLELFAVAETNSAMFHCYQISPGESASWSEWESLGGSVRPYPAVGQNFDGNLEVFAADSQHPAVLNHRRQISANAGWLDWLNMDEPVYQYASRIWQIDEGLPHNDVQAIAQTPDGYLWVGTRGGLARFDGINFTCFDAKHTPEIKNDSISSLCVDREGALWFGTEGGGVGYLKAGVFYNFSKTNGLAGDQVNAVCERNDGSIWIGTTEGLSCYQDGKFTLITEKDGLLSQNVRSLCNDQGGNLWIGTDKGLNRWRNGIKDAFTAANGLPNNSVRGIFADKTGPLCIGTDSGMTLYSGGKFYSFDIKSGLADRVVSAICDDRRGNLWVGTFGGLNRFQEGRFLSEYNSEELPYDRINAFFNDREGNLWAGSKEGLIRLTPKRFFAYTKQQGLTHNDVVSVMEDRVRNFWVGTWGGGLDKIVGESVTAPTGFTNNYVLSLCEAYDGIWIGSDFDGGLAKLSNNRLQYYSWKDGLIRAGLRVLHEDRFLNLWIGTSRGLCRFKNGKFATWTAQDGLAGNDVRAICEDAQGKLWFGTDGGLSSWRDGQFDSFTVKQGLSDNSVTALYGDNGRNLWIGTAAGGLNRYVGGRFTYYTADMGLFSDEIFEIIEDDYGWMWMSCSKGIFRVRKTDFDAFDQKRISSITSIAYGRADGMESTLCNGAAKPGAWKAHDGKLWFSTAKGLVMVDPKIEIQENPPPVFIEKITADNQSVMSGGLGVTNTFDPDSTNSGMHSDDPVQIPPGRGELEFHYTALNFHTPEKSRFKYKLEKVDANWVNAGQRRIAHYNNIYPGSYQFQVIACNSDGVWNEKGAVVTVIVQPHFWQTYWFYIVTGLSCSVVIYSLARYTTKLKMQRKLELLKQQHAVERERGRIAKDIHDDLGSSLTRIMMFGECAQEDLKTQSELEKHIGKIVACARDSVQSLDEIVWAVNPENDTLDGLVAYISQYANQYFENTNIACRLEMPVEFSNFRLSAEVRHDIFLAVKEALNNILKHSQATEAHLQVAEDGSTVTIIIEDNGRGFGETKSLPGRKGHGLENLRKRTESMGGEIIISSKAGQGTKLVMAIPLAAKPDPKPS
jgi:ligand-binding sensor domain-containing protein/signal transduction histidine kinase